MRVSQFEIHRLAQRALEASGAPYGVDRDGALAVAWLEARGLPGLQLLARDLPDLKNCFTGLRADRTRPILEIDAAGISAVAYASAVIDLARTVPALRLRRCRSPLFLLPAASSASVNLRWREALLDAAPVEVDIRPGPLRSDARSLLDPAELARRYETSLLQGIEVDDQIWRRIDAVAAKVQVPASEVSRERGAGGGDANA